MFTALPLPPALFTADGISEHLENSIINFKKKKLRKQTGPAGEHFALEELSSSAHQEWPWGRERAEGSQPALSISRTNRFASEQIRSCAQHWWLWAGTSLCHLCPAPAREREFHSLELQGIIFKLIKCKTNPQAKHPQPQAETWPQNQTQTDGISEQPNEKKLI